MTWMSNRRQGTPNFQTLPMVFIDLETTGDSFQVGGEICESGLVKVDPASLRVLGELDLKFQVANPHGWSEKQLSYDGYNGYNSAEWADALEPVEALKRLQEFTTGCVPWAYNTGFEYAWLRDYFTHYRLDWLGDYHWHCLMSVASHLLRPDFLAGRISKLSLSSVGQYLGLGIEANPHRGLSGARYELELYRVLHGRFPMRPVSTS